MVEKIKKKPMLFSLLLYTVIYLCIYALVFGSNRYMFANDSDTATNSIPLSVRLWGFYRDLWAGTFSALDYKALFGTENLFSMSMPFNPFNFIIPFMPSDSVIYFYKIYYTLTLFLAGVCFIVMCREHGIKPFFGTIAAPLYVFSPYTFIWCTSYSFPAVMVTLPVMITGMERIFRKKGCKTLIFGCAAAVLTTGFYMFVYQLAITVIYAFVRVFFTKGGSFWSRLIDNGLKGAGAALAGLALTAAAAMPLISAIMQSSRTSVIREEVISAAFTPDLSALSNIFYGNGCEYCLGTALAPFLIIFMVMKGAPRFFKTILGICMLGIYIPLFSAVIGTFTYIEHRWAFAFVMAAAYGAAYVIENLHRSELSDRIWISGGLVIYMMTSDILTAKPAAAVLSVYMIIMNITPLRNALDRFLVIIDQKERYILEVIVYLLFLLSAAVMLVINGVHITVFTAVTVFVSVTFICCIENRAVKAKHFMSFIPLAVLPAALTSVYPRTADLNGDPYIHEQYEPLILLEEQDMAAGDEIVRFESIEDFTFFNVAYTHGLAMPNLFMNLLPGRYVEMINEAEFDLSTHSSLVSVSGFEHRLPFLSVWGIDYIHGEEKKNKFLNVPALKVPDTCDEIMSYNAGGGINRVYKNNFCLPFGFTYDSEIRDNERKDLNGADYGINMMYAAGLRDEDIREPYAAAVSCEIPFDIRSEVVKYDEAAGITYTKYTLTPLETVSDSEVYLTMNGVNVNDNYFGNVTVIINENDEHKILGDFGGRAVLGEFNWYVANSSYTWSCSTVEEPVEKVEVIASCKFDDLRLTMFPLSEYKKQFEKLSEYTFENTVLGDDEITGNITVPDERILCLQLQYSTGWRAYDNGEPIEIIPVNGCMTGLRLTPGEHEIRLVYHVPGLMAGVVISAVTVIVLIGVWTATRKKESVAGGAFAAAAVSENADITESALEDEKSGDDL